MPTSSRNHHSAPKENAQLKHNLRRYRKSLNLPEVTFSFFSLSLRKIYPINRRGLGWGAVFGAVKVAVEPDKRGAFAVVAVFEPLAGGSDFMDTGHVAMRVVVLFGGFSFLDLF
jgi:hypothetical protein